VRGGCARCEWPTSSGPGSGRGGSFEGSRHTELLAFVFVVPVSQFRHHPGSSGSAWGVRVMEPGRGQDQRESLLSSVRTGTASSRSEGVASIDARSSGSTVYTLTAVRRFGYINISLSYFIP
jgi:hypothetical protein